MSLHNKKYEMTDIDYWLWLSLKKAMTAEKMQNLFTYISSPKELYNMSKNELSAIKGFNKRTIAVLSDKSLDRVMEIRKLCIKYNKCT
jgi:ERCC4-type nuclease